MEPRHLDVLLCMPSTPGGQVQVPNGAHGNGVIYVDDATTVGGQTCSESEYLGARRQSL